MREAHAHIAAFGQSLSMPSLAGCTSLGECLDRVREIAADVQPGSWIRLTSARPEGWVERRWPTLTELDRAAPHRPCVIMSFDHHMGVANTPAIRSAGLRAHEPVPPKGVVCVDDGGTLTGMLLEHAAVKCWESAPEPTKEQRREHVAAGLRALADLGFTEVHDLHSPEWLGGVLASLELNDEMPVEHVWMYPNVAKLEDVFATRQRWQSDRVRLAGGKIFSDGTLNSRTALMLEPYREPLDGRPLGVMMASPAELEAAVRLTESLGLHLATHAIGDGAVRMVLDAVERATTRPRGDSKTDNRHRIEHCELIDEADVGRFASLGVVCSVQPCHLLTDVEVLTRQLPHRLHRVLPLRELIESGCRPAGTDGAGLLWFGSDVPIVRANPEDSIVAATLRRRPNMSPDQSIAWEQRISEAEARACFGQVPSPAGS